MSKDVSTTSTNWPEGLAVGLVAGLAGSWAMTQVQSLLSSAVKRIRSHQDRDQQPSEQSSEPATVKLARRLSEVGLHRELAEDSKAVAGQIVHYGYGGMVGSIYGGLVELQPGIRRGMGVPYGVALWLVGDETAVPLLKLSEAPWKFPVSTHLYALASHIAYGFTTETVRRGLVGLLDWVSRTRSPRAGAPGQIRPERVRITAPTG